MSAGGDVLSELREEDSQDHSLRRKDSCRNTVLL